MYKLIVPLHHLLLTHAIIVQLVVSSVEVCTKILFCFYYLFLASRTKLWGSGNLLLSYDGVCDIIAIENNLLQLQISTQELLPSVVLNHLLNLQFSHHFYQLANHLWSQVQFHLISQALSLTVLEKIHQSCHPLNYHQYLVASHHNYHPLNHHRYLVASHHYNQV